MTDRESIASLIDALNVALEAYSTASTRKQKTARLERVISAGIALRERLQDLRTWLDANWEKGGDDIYLRNLSKYDAGWDALNKVKDMPAEWQRVHYEEVGPDDDRDRTGRREAATRQAASLPRATAKAQSSTKAAGQAVGVRQSSSRQGERSHVTRTTGQDVPEFVQHELV